MFITGFLHEESNQLHHYVLDWEARFTGVLCAHLSGKNIILQIYFQLH